ncbi:MAG TPA: hypothetical protein VHA73_07865 [Acidimicrobiales bacterium]|nr:hypothetical protein [Acidimicrobiales bacterium]
MPERPDTESPTAELSPAGDGSGAGQTIERGRWADVAAVTVLVAAFALPLRGLLRYQGPPMEEGFMLTFPELVLHGAVPNRDFLHLYGPGSLWALAGAYKVFGASLATERWFGLLQHMGIVFGVYAIARRWGRWLALVCGLTSLVIIISPVGLTAMAWNGAVALGVWGVWTALGAHRAVARADGCGDAAAATDERVEQHIRRMLFAGGLLGGFALLFRPDLILAVALGLGGAAWGLSRRRVRTLVVGALVGVAPMAVHVALAGPGHSFQGMVIDPVFRLRAGRSLPVPPSWSHLDGFLQRAAGLQRPGWPLPALHASNQVFLWFFLGPLSALFVGAVGLWAYRRDQRDVRARILLAAGLFGVGMLTQAVQRPDTAHFAWVSCVPLALVPVAVTEVLRARRGRGGEQRKLQVGRALGAAVIVVVLGGVIPHFTLRSYVDLSEQSFGRNVFGYPVHRDGRVVYYGSAQIASAANALLRDLDRRDPKAGQRLFVGPIDLRRTPYSDAFFYFLYPKLKPATYFIEMDPFDSDPGSRLAHDVASADWLILSGVWSNWDEPNTSRNYGSNVPNYVVRTRFCLLGSYGHRTDRAEPLFELWRRCR